ncbi:MAG: GNAT family N-acetyltransferase [Sphingobium sp.]|jgi:RimJ/RimL family protein N-acetyltransferase|nr:GNAT family N-acetyltransferase [Sphingobium sp.]MCP5400596.1 GNAT family N-acetyltransferase [Sphingomonas sp.]
MIETERLVLRPYELADFEAYRAIVSDPYVMRFIGGAPLTAEDAWSRILRYAGHWQLLNFGVFAVRDKASGELIGETGLFDYRRGLGEDFDHFPEIGWIFRTDIQGRGYAYEAVQAAHGWLDANRGQARTVCMIDPENTPSMRLAAKLGYAPFGQRRYKDHDVIVLERLPD